MPDKDSPVFQTRQALQRKLDDYRARAERLYGSEHVKVNPHGPVSPCYEGGAFVELTAWVPDEDLVEVCLGCGAPATVRRPSFRRRL